MIGGGAGGGNVTVNDQLIAGLTIAKTVAKAYPREFGGYG
jgi:hypothetical protein